MISENRICKKELGGFALILALMIMSLILVLSLSLSSMIKSSIAQAKGLSDDHKIRLTARLAIQNAIGTLQKEAGKDQVVTSMASIKDTKISNIKVEGVENPYWTGLWNAEDRSFIRWLVSSPDSNDHSQLSPLSTPSSDSVEMVPAKGVHGNSRAVTVPLQILEDENGKEFGRFAWWVSDESVKGKLNAIDPKYTSSSESNYIHLPGKTGMELSGENGRGLLSQTNEVYQELYKVLSFDSYNLVKKNEVELKNYWHDYTAHSKGVLSNTKEGGLRKDLTRALALNSTELTGPIFVNKKNKDLWSGCGPDWELLRSFFNMRADSNGKVQVRPHQINSGGLPLLVNRQQRFGAVQNGIYPLISRMQIYFYPVLVPDGSDYKARMYHVPVIALWNPYDVTLKAVDYVVTVTLGDVDHFNWAYEIKDKTTPVANIIASGVFEDIIHTTRAGGLFQTQLTYRLNCPDIPPGEAIAFGVRDKNVAIPSDRTVPVDLHPDDKFIYGCFEESVDSFPLSLPYNNYEMQVYADCSELYPQSSVRIFREPASVSSYKDAGTQIYAFGSSKLGEVPLHATKHKKKIAIGDQTPVLDPCQIRDPSGINDSTPFSVNLPNKWPVYGWEWSHYLPETNFSYNPIADFLPPNRIYGARNLRAPFVSKLRQHRDANDLSSDIGNNSNYVYMSKNVQNVQSDVDQQVAFEALSGGQTYVGYSENSSVGQLKSILYHALSEDEVVHSVGQLRHCNLFEFIWATNTQIGNSQSLAFVPRDVDPESLFDMTSTAQPYYARKFMVIGDVNYIANDSLWDRFYFSTLEPASNPFEIKNTKLIHRPFPGEPKEDIFEFDKSSAHLMLNGAFNVNSTSVEAWKGLIASYYFNDAQTANYKIKEKALYSLFPNLQADEFDEDPISLEAFAGYRALNSSEIQSLAEKIVEQVKLRGPFMSLAEFVNRKLNKVNPFAQMPKTVLEKANNPEYMGALDSAIYNSGINRTLDAVKVLESEIHTSYFDGSGNFVIKRQPFNRGADMGSSMQGLSSYLQQGDLLEKLGSLLTVRSDTFIIRGYGELVDAVTGNRTGKHCEAVVQRVPDPVEPDLINPYEPSAQSTMGRKFKMIHFRWLSPDQL